jgi:hypothetical protein
MERSADGQGSDHCAAPITKKSETDRHQLPAGGRLFVSDIMSNILRKENAK